MVGEADGGMRGSACGRGPGGFSGGGSGRLGGAWVVRGRPRPNVLGPEGGQETPPERAQEEGEVGPFHLRVRKRGSGPEASEQAAGAPLGVRPVEGSGGRRGALQVPLRCPRRLPTPRRRLMAPARYPRGC